MPKRSSTVRAARLSFLLEDLGKFKDLEKFFITSKSAVYKVGPKNSLTYVGQNTALGSLVRAREMEFPEYILTPLEGFDGVYTYKKAE